MRDSFPMLLREATLSLYPADEDGNALIEAPVWCGMAANGLRLARAWEEQLAFSSGDRYKTAHHTDEIHAIEVERTWILRSATADEDCGPQRNQPYVLEIVWHDTAQNIWHKRTYYGVTGRNSDLNSDGPRQHQNPQSFRAQYFIQTGGEGDPDIYTPVATVENEQLAGFFSENPALLNAYLLGIYRWETDKRITGARFGYWPPQEETQIELELDGVLSGDIITLPAGTANTDTTGTASFNRAVPAGTEVRCKVVAGPADAETALWHLGLILSLVDD